MRILIVEDETLFAQAIARRLQCEGHSCIVAGTLAHARGALNAGEGPPDLVLLDVRLPDGNGLDLLAAASEAADRRPAFIVLTAFGDIEDAVVAMKLGARDYLKKPIDLGELTVAIEKISRVEGIKRRLDLAHARVDRLPERAELIGRSPALERTRRQIETIGASAGADATGPPPTVLILGETGTGKDLAARRLHAAGPRARAPFVHVDCAALPKDLIETELFGHAKGAFTGAQAARVGLIEAAEGGTVFLDEIGELPAALQVKLLSVLERRRVRRVGGTAEIGVRAGFIAATNRDLARMVAERSFREDLYYRLNVLTLRMPALRACQDDIPQLAAHFCEKFARRFGRPSPRMTRAALDRLGQYHWPGNVRELRHVIERAIVLSDQPELDVADLGLDAHGAIPPAPSDGSDPLAGLTLDEAERLMIERALRRTGGNVSEAARRLAVTRMALRYRIEKYGLAGPDAQS